MLAKNGGSVEGALTWWGKKVGPRKAELEEEEI